MRFQRGSVSESKFLELYNRTAPSLHRYAARTLGNAAAADDVVQETYVRAICADSLPVDQAQARAYLFKVASNLIVDLWRRNKRERDAADTIETAAYDADANLRLDVNAMMARLRLPERQLLWLAYVEGADHAAIADVLGLAEGSVKVLLHRAKRKLADMLRGGGYGEG
jgi:RNA polymerase sigma-70 factor (ECF subfamily)